MLSDDTDSMVKNNYNAYKAMVEEVIAGRDSKRADKIDGVQLAPGTYSQLSKSQSCSDFLCHLL